MVPFPLPEGWREHITVEERDITNRWMRGIDWCVTKVGKRHWDSNIPGAPLFKTKTAAHEFVSRFVCDVIPMRCVERMEGKL